MKILLIFYFFILKLLVSLLFLQDGDESGGKKCAELAGVQCLQNTTQSRHPSKKILRYALHSPNENKREGRSKLGTRSSRDSKDEQRSDRRTHAALLKGRSLEAVLLTK